jgi:hypothetical protein
MNGATAEPSVSTIRIDSINIVRTIGPSHHFLRTFMKDHSSPKIVIFPPEERAIWNLPSYPGPLNRRQRSPITYQSSANFSRQSKSSCSSGWSVFKRTWLPSTSTSMFVRMKHR